jgi:hypothetical protein
MSHVTGTTGPRGYDKYLKKLIKSNKNKKKLFTLITPEEVMKGLKKFLFGWFVFLLKFRIGWRQWEALTCAGQPSE